MYIKVYYKLTKKVYASGFVAGLVGSLANTAGVLGMIYILYSDKYLALLGQQGASAGKTFIWQLLLQVEYLKL